MLTTTGTVSDSFMTIEAQEGLYITVKKYSNNVTVIVDSVGTLVSVDEEPTAEVVTSYELNQNYPNPFNPATTIQFSVPQASFVKLEIFNALGESIGVVVSEQLSAGSYKYNWNASGFTSGIYIYQITAGSFKQAKKMILMK